MKRTAVLLVLALIILGVGSGPRTANAAGDTITPRLNSISLSSPGPFTPPDSISVLFDAIDAQNVKYVVLAFQTPTGGTIAMPKFSTANGVQVSQPVTRALVFDSLAQIDFGYLPSGTYTFLSVDVADWSTPQPNEVNCLRNGTATANPVSSSLPADPCPDTAELQALDFVINNPNGDSAAPELTSLILPTGSYQPGDEVEIQLDATDNGGSGVRSMGFSWVNMGNPAQYIEGSLNDASGTARIDIKDNTPPGTYQFSSIIVRDRLQNTLTYSSDGSLIKTPPGVSAPTPPHSIDMSATFTVVNPNADTSTPVLTSFQRTSPLVIGPGSNVNISLVVSDVGGSGVDAILFDYDPPSGLPFVVFAQNGSGNGGNISTQLPPAYPPGNYFLSTIRIIDNDGNEVRYFRGGTSAGIPQGVTFPPQPAGFAAMFAQADFTAGSAAGIDVATIFPRSAQANSGQTFTLTVTGTNFTETSIVFFGAASLGTISREGSTVIHATVPGSLLSGSARTVQVTVTTPFTLTSLNAPDASSLTFEITEFAAADVNADNCLDIYDALAVRQHVASVTVTASGCGQLAAPNFDADRNTVENSADALYVLKVLAGLLPR